MNAKQIAAEKAVTYIRDEMIVGLGTGSTAYWAIQKIGEEVRQGLKVKVVASSLQSENLAKELGIPIIAFDQVEKIDVTIDGADEVDKNLNLIKGGGGALLREKIIAYNSQQFIVIVDSSKRVDVLGKFPLPVEIAPFAFELTIRNIEKLGCTVKIRNKEGRDFVTDNGNYIADCNFNEIPDPLSLSNDLHEIPGVLETGLFINKLVHFVIVGHDDGSTEMLGTL